MQTLSDGTQVMRLPNEMPRPTVPEFGALENLRAWLSSLCKSSGWLLWRGHSSFEYRLTSKLQRIFDDTGIESTDRSAVESAAIDEFKRRADPALRGMPTTGRLAYLGVMQHYGAPTRLTDWSRDPRIALWFACESENAATDRALFVLDARLCGSVYPIASPEVIEGKSDDHEKWSCLYSRAETLLGEAEQHGIAWPLPLTVFPATQRMVAQEAAFVCDGTLQAPLELLLTDTGWEAAKRATGFIDHVGWHLAGLSNSALTCHREHLVQKIRIRAALRDEILAWLELEGITRARLFPDAVGTDASLDGIGIEIDAFIRQWHSRATAMRDRVHSGG